ncbi:hypothetical protein D3C81_1112530 [compost metagenome]
MIIGRKINTGHTCTNLVKKNIMVTIKLIRAPMLLMISLAIQPLGFSRTHLKIMPVWERVNGMNTPTAYSGIRCSVCPLNTRINRMEQTPRIIIPLEYPKRSPRTVNILGMNLSFARLTASSGNAEYPVLAARIKIKAVVP